MISLKELAAEISKDEVDVRGRKIDIRALAARETARLSELFPRPMPPLLPSHQGRVPAENTNDPAFVAADNAWGWQRKVMEVALGCGWLTGGTLFQGDGAKVFVFARKHGNYGDFFVGDQREHIINMLIFVYGKIPHR